MDVCNVEALSQKYGVPGYSEERLLLGHPGLDAIYIGTPVHLHLEHIR